MKTTETTKFLVDAQKLYIEHQAATNADDFKRLQMEIDKVLIKYNNDVFAQNILTKVYDEIHRYNRIKNQLPQDIEQLKEMSYKELQSYNLDAKVQEYKGDDYVRSVLEMTINYEKSKKLSPNIFANISTYIEKYKDTSIEDDYWKAVLETSRKMSDFYCNTTFAKQLILDSICLLQDIQEEKNDLKNTA